MVPGGIKSSGPSPKGTASTLFVQNRELKLFSGSQIEAGTSGQ